MVLTTQSHCVFLKGAHHTQSLCFPKWHVIISTQSHRAFLKGVWLSPHGKILFSQRLCGSHHIKLLCFPKGCVALTTQNQCVFTNGVWLPPCNVIVFVIVLSKGVSGSYHTESLWFPKWGCGSHHAASLLFPMRRVALTTQSHCVF